MLLSESVKNARLKPTKATKKTKTSSRAKGKEAIDAEVLEVLSKREPIPPYEYFQTMQELEVPGYRTEVAVSGRSKCAGSALKPDSVAYCKNVNVGSKLNTQLNTRGSKPKFAKATGLEVVACKEFGKIALNAIRIGTMIPASGTYGRFKHLSCWRVPKAVWYALPRFPTSEEWNEAEFARRLARMNEVIFCGFGNLCDADRLLVAKHTMDQSMWANFEEKSSRNTRAAILPSTPRTEVLAQDADSEIFVIKKENSGVTKVKKEFRLAIKTELHPPRIALPIPNVNGAKARVFCRSAKPLVFVLTGVFPKLGGGVGLNEGKEKAAELIRIFGGVVRSTISGRTDVLLVGEAPGVAKLTSARSQSNIKILNLEHILDLIYGRSIENKPLKIDSFSTGFRGNSLAYDMTRAELDALRFGESITAPAEKNVLSATDSKEGMGFLPNKAAPSSCVNSTLTSKTSHTSRKRVQSASTDVARRSARIARRE